MCLVKKLRLQRKPTTVNGTMSVSYGNQTRAYGNFTQTVLSKTVADDCQEEKQSKVAHATF